jgi:hypothetical protein
VRVAAARPGAEALLIDLEDGFGGRVLDMETRQLHRRMPLGSLAQRGYWDPPPDGLPPLPELLETSRDVETPEEADYYEAQRP